MPVHELKRILRNPHSLQLIHLSHILEPISPMREFSEWTYAAACRDKWSYDDLWPHPLITGQTLIDMGYVPGPAFKDALRVVENAQLDGIVTSLMEARVLAIDTLTRANAPRGDKQPN